MRTRLVVVLSAALASSSALAQPLTGGPGTGVRVASDGRVTVDDAALGFTLKLPKGAQVVPGAMTGDLAYVFSLPEPAGTTVAVQRLGKRISPKFTEADAAKVKPLPPGVQLVPGKWRGLTLMVLRAEQSTPQGALVDYGAGIPLQREGIQLHVAGPKANDAQLQKLLADLLGTLSGEPAK